MRSSSIAAATRSRAMSAAPTGTRTDFSATSVTRLTGPLAAFFASAACFAALVRVRVAVAFVLVAVVLRAVAPRLAARVCAAFFAVVERLMAFALRVAAAFFAAVLGSVWVVVVVSAMVHAS